MRKSIGSLVLVFFTTAWLNAQLASTAGFEVATIKPGISPAAQIRAGKTPQLGTVIRGSTVEIGFASIESLIETAYSVKSYQVSGPDWMNSQRFDIVAKLPDGATTEQLPEMLQALLADRFKLAVRRESKEGPVYALTIGKDGQKLNDAVSDSNFLERPTANTKGPVLYIADARPNGWRTYSSVNGVMTFDADKITMPELALALMPYVDIPVIDMTELRGAYQVSLEVPGGPNYKRAPALATTAGEASDPSGVSIFASVRKLGLQMDKRTVRIEHLMVEHLEKDPSDN